VNLTFEAFFPKVMLFPMYDPGPRWELEFILSYSRISANVKLTLATFYDFLPVFNFLFEFWYELKYLKYATELALFFIYFLSLRGFASFSTGNSSYYIGCSTF
jgi:hypothetical protein